MDRTGLVMLGGHMEWMGHTYRGGSAGYAHKPNSNQYWFLKGGMGEEGRREEGRTDQGSSVLKVSRQGFGDLHQEVQTVWLEESLIWIHGGGQDH